MIGTIELFKALGDETRLRLVNLFLRTDDDICVCEMVDALALPQYQISKHLAILKNAGLLQAKRRGTWVYYRLDHEESSFLRDFFKVLSRHLEQERFANDAEKLLHRMALREEGKCIVGFVSVAEITRDLRQRKVKKNAKFKKTRHLHLHP
ncbi:MAG: ArsR/SmtB family transcription factor [bacterium]